MFTVWWGRTMENLILYAFVFLFFSFPFVLKCSFVLKYSFAQNIPLFEKVLYFNFFLCSPCGGDERWKNLIFYAFVFLFFCFLLFWNVPLFWNIPLLKMFVCLKRSFVLIFFFVHRCGDERWERLILYAWPPMSGNALLPYYSYLTWTHLFIHYFYLTCTFYSYIEDEKIIFLSVKVNWGNNNNNLWWIAPTINLKIKSLAFAEKTRPFKSKTVF